jgi:hypothetical protein
VHGKCDHSFNQTELDMVTLEHIQNRLKKLQAYLEATEEANFRRASAAAGGDFSRTGGPQGIEDCRRAHHGRPRSYVFDDSAKVCRIQRGRIHQRQERDSDSAKVGARQRNFTGEHFWARGYFVSTVGLDEHMVRANIRNQEEEDECYDQMKLVME